jgi:alkylhydroperoxidase family enzyme
MPGTGNDTTVDSARARAIAAREELILGKPPRITPLDKKRFGEFAMSWWVKLRKHISGDDSAPPAGAEIPQIYFYMLRCPELWDRITKLSIQLQRDGQLCFRDRELAILRTGWLCQAPFEWSEHVRKARKEGFTHDEIERITLGSSAPGWDEHEQAILCAVEELHAGAMISDGTWQSLARQLTEEQLLEFTVLVGLFTTVAYFQNALRLPLLEDSAGLAAR